MAQGGSNRKVVNSLLAAGAAAVLAVYAAGYERTRPAAEQLEAQSAVRRPLARPAPAAAPPTSTLQPKEPREATLEVGVLARPVEPAAAVVAPPPPAAKTNITPTAP